MSASAVPAGADSLFRFGRFWLCALAGLIPTALILIYSPTLLALIGLVLLGTPTYGRPEVLGFSQSIGAVSFGIGSANLSDGVSALPWLGAGVIVMALGLIRYRHELAGGRLSSRAVACRAPAGTHEAVVALAVSIAAGILVVTDVSNTDPPYHGYPLAFAGIALAATPLAANGTVWRVAARALAAAGLALLAILDASGFYFLVSAALMTVSMLRR